MWQSNSRIDLRPSIILHAASASHCDTCWLAPWCENIHVSAFLPCKKRVWITVLRKQRSSGINPPTHHTNLAVSIKLDFLIAGGICTALSPDSGITGIHLCKQQRWWHAVACRKSSHKPLVLVHLALVSDTGQAYSKGKGHGPKAEHKICWRDVCIFLTCFDSQKNSNRVDALFQFFMILKKKSEKVFFQLVLFFSLPTF